MFMRVALAVVGGYLLGGVDFAVIVARAKGIDIFSVGSGNPGTSNVLRTMGRGPAAIVLLGDLLKGVVAAAIGFFLSGAGSGPFDGMALATLAGLAAVAGHCYPILHRFRGGKGVATGFGVLLWVQPVVAIGLGVVWALIVKVIRVASIGSLVVVVAAVPALMALGVTGWPLVWVGGTLLLIVFRHRGNIQRMFSGGDRKVVEA
ncbi:MAG: glycerol-3-phosphate acyltransferase [Acidimicrobiia bacterium]|nr:glycerol-3-phosphate acyltransferase [Acidimicrobiia bacterium]